MIFGCSLLSKECNIPMDSMFMFQYDGGGGVWFSMYVAYVQPMQRHAQNHQRRLMKTCLFRSAHFQLMFCTFTPHSLFLIYLMFLFRPMNSMKLEAIDRAEIRKDTFPIELSVIQSESFPLAALESDKVTSEQHIEDRLKKIKTNISFLYSF